MFEYPTLNINIGDVIGLIGNNGSGKTTFMKNLFNSLKNKDVVSNFSGTVALVEQIQPIVDTGSGGEITKRAIVNALHKSPDLLILDEPSTNLDVIQQKWLFRQIQHYSGTVILITHDENLLKLTNRIWSIEYRKLNDFNVNYKNYVEIQSKKNQKLHLAYRRQKQEIDRLKKQVIKRKQTANRIKHGNGKKISSSEFKNAKTHHDSMEKKMQKKASALESRINKIDKITLPKQSKPVRFVDPSSKYLSKKTVLNIDNCDIKFNGRTLINNVHLLLKYGEHIFIKGNNGVGKTTLIKNILAHKDTFINKSVKVGYFDQMNQNLEASKTVWQNAISISNQNNQVVLHVLSALGLLELQQKLVVSLSGGQKVRLQLAKVLLGNHQILILDEPTNYLDLRAKQALIDFLNNYPGTIILVSHDVSFTNQINGYFYTIEDNHLLSELGTQKFSDSNQELILNLKYKLDLMMLDEDVNIEQLRKIKARITSLENS
ncbi:ATP-binding cassette domain-containing protein [Apilactobacillus ozensis]|uniref:ATP-binding cassette domain-containing protein n=1 Tax=Apilactobacillus ozensis TaxID=866801 RepID=UPI00200B4FE9|nr:ATP-binding cassette domain-containing protein [Apilactobacillus ozensis]MCK8607195.1 ATP-binding cassette domain-containing protein [Apilactobacillus ozensis]